MTSGDRAAEQYEQDQPRQVPLPTVRTIHDFQPGDHVWYQPPEDGDEYAGVVDEFTAAGTLRITIRRWVKGEAHLTHSIVGQYAINEGRLYRRQDGEDIHG